MSKKMVKRYLGALIAAILLLSAPLIAAEETPTPVRVASLKGPTSMGMAKLIEDDKVGASQNDYEFTIAGTADEIVPRIVKGELDLALIPCNLASVLYGKTAGSIELVAINTLGVLYVVEAGDAIHSVADLKDATLYSTGKGTTPEFALNYVLAGNGLTPGVDLTIEYKSEATEVAAALANGTVSAALLPQPYVTSVLAQNKDLRVALSLTDEWSRVNADSALVTGVVVARKDFALEHPDQLNAFLEEYARSTVYVNEHPAEAAEWIAQMQIVAKAAIAEAAIPACNIVCITGTEMKTKVSGYLAALYEQNPASVGGTLPDDAFYFIGEAES